MAHKVHILGFSGNAGQKHKAAFKQLPDLYELTSDYDEADIIDICTPNYLHFSQTIDALEHEKHVIVEKPMCGSIKEGREIQSKEIETDFNVFPVFQHKIQTYSNMDRIYRRPPEYFGGWRGDFAQSLGDDLTIFGIHDIHAISQTKHRISRVEHTQIGTQDFYTFGLKHRPCESISFSISTSPVTSKNALKSRHEDFVEYFEKIHTAITGNRLSAPYTSSDALISIELLTACYKARTITTPIKLPILPSHPFYRGWTQHFARLHRQSEPSPKISV